MVAIDDVASAWETQRPAIHLVGFGIPEQEIPAAEREYRDGIAANPDSVVMQLALAKFYSDSGQNQQAADVMQKVIELQPENVSHRYNLANLYWADGRREAAGEIIAEVLSADPANEDYRLIATYGYQAKSEVEAA